MNIRTIRPMSFTSTIPMKHVTSKPPVNCLKTSKSMKEKSLLVAMMKIQCDSLKIMVALERRAWRKKKTTMIWILMTFKNVKVINIILGIL